MNFIAVCLIMVRYCCQMFPYLRNVPENLAKKELLRALGWPFLAFLTRHKRFYNVWNAASARSIISTSIQSWVELFIYQAGWWVSPAGAWNGRLAKRSRPFSIAHTESSKWEGGVKKKLCSVELLCQLQNEPGSRHPPFKHQLWPTNPQKFFTTPGIFLANLLFHPIIRDRCWSAYIISSYLSFSRTSISMDWSSGTEIEQSVKTTRLRRDIGRGSCSFDASKRQAEANSCSWVLQNNKIGLKVRLTLKKVFFNHTGNYFCIQHLRDSKVEPIWNPVDILLCTFWSITNWPFYGKACEDPVEILNCGEKNLGAAFLLLCHLAKNILMKKALF